MSKQTAQKDKEAAAAANQMAAPSDAAAAPQTGAHIAAHDQTGGDAAGPSTSGAPAPEAQAHAGTSSRANSPTQATGDAQQPPAAIGSDAAPAGARGPSPSNTGEHAAGNEQPLPLPQRDRAVRRGNRLTAPNPAPQQAQQPGARTAANKRSAGNATAGRGGTAAQTAQRQQPLRELVIKGTKANATTFVKGANPIITLAASVAASKERTGLDYNTLATALEAAARQQVLALIETRVPLEKRSGADKVQVSVTWRTGPSEQQQASREQGRYTCLIQAPQELGQALRAALFSADADGTIAVSLPDRAPIHMALHQSASQDSKAASYLLRMIAQGDIQTSAAAAVLADASTPVPSGLFYREAHWVATAVETATGELMLANVTTIADQTVKTALKPLPTYAVGSVQKGDHVALVSGGLGMLVHSLKGPVTYDVSEADGLATSSMHSNPKMRFTMRKVPTSIPPAREGSLQRVPGKAPWSQGSAGNASTSPDQGRSQPGSGSAPAPTPAPGPTAPSPQPDAEAATEAEGARAASSEAMETEQGADAPAPTPGPNDPAAPSPQQQAQPVHEDGTDQEGDAEQEDAAMTDTVEAEWVADAAVAAASIATAAVGAVIARAQAEEAERIRAAAQEREAAQNRKATQAAAKEAEARRPAPARPSGRGPHSLSLQALQHLGGTRASSREAAPATGRASSSSTSHGSSGRGSPSREGDKGDTATSSGGWQTAGGNRGKRGSNSSHRSPNTTVAHPPKRNAAHNAGARASLSNAFDALAEEPDDDVSLAMPPSGGQAMGTGAGREAGTSRQQDGAAPTTTRPAAPFSNRGTTGAHAAPGAAQ
jgi:hypothetical protein